MKLIFQLLGIIGFDVICLCALIIPKNPYKIIPSYSFLCFDKPLWLCIIAGGSFIYFLILSAIYESLVDLDLED